MYGTAVANCLCANTGYFGVPSWEEKRELDTEVTLIFCILTVSREYANLFLKQHKQKKLHND